MFSRFYWISMIMLYGVTGEDTLRQSTDWMISSWTKCTSKCGPQVQTRNALCVSATGNIVSDTLCKESKKPFLVKKCDMPRECNNRWYASEWSECSADNNYGIRTRHVICGRLHGDEVITIVDPVKCNSHITISSNETCTGVGSPQNEWYTSEFQKCSQPCGGGHKKRLVFCIKNGTRVHDSSCSITAKPFIRETCNTHSCSEDLMNIATFDEQKEDLIHRKIDIFQEEEDIAETASDSVFKMISNKNKRINLQRFEETQDNDASIIMEANSILLNLRNEMRKDRQFSVNEGSGDSEFVEDVLITGIRTPLDRLVVGYVVLRKRFESFQRQIQRLGQSLKFL